MEKIVPMTVETVSYKNKKHSISVIIIVCIIIFINTVHLRTITSEKNLRSYRGNGH